MKDMKDHHKDHGTPHRAQETLEQVIQTKIKPILETNLQRVLGVTIEELNKDISSRLQKNPLLDFPIDTSISFKQAKKQFKNQYLKKLLQIRYGNISEVAKLADVDRRSIHRIVKESKLNVDKIRHDMARAYDVKREAVTQIIEDVLNSYKEVIHPVKLEKAYENVNEVSKEVLEQLPEEPLTLKEAETNFEREFLQKALKENQDNLTQTAKQIGLRYETLHRKIKKLGLINTA
ncbi:TPA: hypothetical protein HA249_02145 [Candidatus Woesearchaeota archaeon]|nr:hypothetical protein [Candidatus Woesearchaeota archaeon]HIH47384.1 hypothetical protein [Candidatus Woesearchaeota archaeon]HII88303.1 hypothetical protein [Candidatus Woesearchaeota archaeon]